MSQLGGGDSSAGGAGADTTPPAISKLRMTHRRFKVRRNASAFLFSLSEDSRASVAIARCVKLRKLTHGRYRATVGAVDAAGNRAAPRRVRFSIVRR
jgi:hypothetical protein